MKYVAFLRGINVGGRIIKMADLKVCFEQAGFENVSTVLQTGNVLFESDSDNLKSRLESILSTTFKYPAKVQVLEISKLQKIIESYPFDDIDEAMQHYVIFLENGLEKELAETAKPDPEIEATQIGDGVVYWKVRKGMTLKSPFSKYLTKTKYKDFNTNRNLNTLNKLIV